MESLYQQPIPIDGSAFFIIICALAGKCVEKNPSSPKKL